MLEDLPAPLDAAVPAAAAAAVVTALARFPGQDQLYHLLLPQLLQELLLLLGFYSAA
jgi:hypothetical protein